MIMVIPKNPEKYRKNADGNIHHTRERTGDLLFQIPSHLRKAG